MTKNCQKMLKSDFFGKKSCFLPFLFLIFKNIALFKYLKKLFLDLCPNMIFKLSVWLLSRFAYPHLPTPPIKHNKTLTSHVEIFFIASYYIEYWWYFLFGLYQQMLIPTYTHPTHKTQQDTYLPCWDILHSLLVHWVLVVLPVWPLSADAYPPLTICYHLFSHEAQGRNVPNSLTVGMGFHCSYVPSGT